MTIILPLPDRRLSPNSRSHWSGLSKAKKAARQLAYLTTLSALQGKPSPCVSRYRLDFYFSVRRRRDDDNFAAACKAYRDGIADALRIDDTDLVLCAAPEMHQDKASPRLEIHLLP
jgi:hypothetical protein